MRDIRKKGKGKRPGGERFNPKPPFPEDLPPDVKELYEKYAHQKDEPPEESEEMEQEGAEEEESLPPNVPRQQESEEEVEVKKSKTEKPRFTGSKVPIANVHVSRQEPSDKANRVTRRNHARVEESQEMEQPRSKKKSAPGKGGRPLFASVDEEEAPATKKPKKKRKAKRQTMRLGHRDRKLVAILLLVVMVVAGLAAMLFLPRANLTLTLATAPLLVDHAFTVQAGGAVETNMVPGQVHSKEMEVEGSSAVSSTKIVGEKAEGVVRLINRTFEEQSIKEQSRLVTEDGRLYFMQERAVIPAAEGATLGVATVQVVADAAGPEANLESGRLNFAALDSSAQSVVYAEVAEPISGGSGEEVMVVTEEALDQARDEARQLAWRQLAETTELPEGYTLLEESREAEIQSFETTVAADEEAETIPFTATILARVMAYEEATLEKSLRSALEGQLDEDYMLFPAPLSFTKSVDEIDWENQQAEVTARVTHTTIPTFSLDTLKDKLAGRSEAEAREYLQGLAGVKSVQMDMWPFWVQSIPRIEQRVSIELEPDRQP